MAEALQNQITDRNFLQATGFSFTVNRARHLGFYGNSINVPGLVLGTVEQPSYTRMIPRPGELLEFNDLRIRFLIDQGLQNYNEIQNWMRGLGFPESLDEIYQFQKDGPIDNGGIKNLFSDGTLTILNGINRASATNNFTIKSPIAHIIHREVSNSIQKTGIFSIAKESPYPRNEKFKEKAILKNIVVSSNEPSADEIIGAFHQVCLIYLLKIYISII